MTELAAYHEAGHCLVAYLLRGKLKQVTIDSERDDGRERYGETQMRWKRGLCEKGFAQKIVRVSFAGLVAEMIYSGDPDPSRQHYHSETGEPLAINVISIAGY